MVRAVYRCRPSCLVLLSPQSCNILSDTIIKILVTRSLNTSRPHQIPEISYAYIDKIVTKNCIKVSKVAYNSSPTLSASHKESLTYRVPGWCMARWLSENGRIFYILITEIDKLISWYELSYILIIFNKNTHLLTYNQPGHWHQQSTTVKSSWSLLSLLQPHQYGLMVTLQQRLFWSDFVPWSDPFWMRRIGLWCRERERERERWRGGYSN